MQGYSLGTAVPTSFNTPALFTPVKYTFAEALPLFSKFIKQVAEKYGRKIGQELSNDFEQVGQIALWKACDKFNPANGTPFENYARCAIRNSIISSLKSLKYDHSVFQYQEERDQHDVTQDEHEESEAEFTTDDYHYFTEQELYIVRSQLEARVEHVKQNITAKQQIIFEKIYHEGMSVTEVAKELGISHQTVSKQYRTIEGLIHSSVVDQLH